MIEPEWILTSPPPGRRGSGDHERHRLAGPGRATPRPRRRRRPGGRARPRWVNGTEDQQPSERGHRRAPDRRALSCTNVAGAGDENRTRTISLGSSAVTAARGADQALLVVPSDPGCPLVTLANGTLMARRSCPDVKRTRVGRAGSVPCSSPVLLVAARPWPLAAVSRLAKRPASAGLALTRWTRPRTSSSEEGGDHQLGRLRLDPARPAFMQAAVEVFVP